MKTLSFLGPCLVLANASPATAQKCPTIETSVMDKGFAEFAPWRVVSGGPAECTFMTRNSSINLGFNHIVTKSADAAVVAATEWKQAVAASSTVEPMSSLGERGFTYQPKSTTGQVDRMSMFLYGHRGTVNVSGYLNLRQPISPDQRMLAGTMIAATLPVAQVSLRASGRALCP